MKRSVKISTIIKWSKLVTPPGDYEWYSTKDYSFMEHTFSLVRVQGYYSDAYGVRNKTFEAAVVARLSRAFEVIDDISPKMTYNRLSSVPGE